MGDWDVRVHLQLRRDWHVNSMFRLGVQSSVGEKSVPMSVMMSAHVVFACVVEDVGVGDVLVAVIAMN